MFKRDITIRLFIICVLCWVVIIGLYDNVSNESNANHLIAIYGIVTDDPVEVTANGIVVLVENGPDEWRILFSNSDQMPEINKAVIITVEQATDGILIAVSFCYP